VRRGAFDIDTLLTEWISTAAGMGPRGLDLDIADPQASELGDAQAAAARQTHENQVNPRVCETSGPLREAARGSCPTPPSPLK